MGCLVKKTRNSERQTTNRVRARVNVFASVVFTRDVEYYGVIAKTKVAWTIVGSG